MTKAYFYKTDGGELLRCMFAGLDRDGQAHWVVIDQGSETMTLQDYLDEFCMESSSIHLLCLEGELLESETLAVLLGSVHQSYPIDCKKSLSDTIKKLKRKGIDWKHEVVELKVRVHEYVDQVLKEDCLYYSIMANGRVCLAELDAFHSPKELMNSVRCFFEALEKEADIVLKKELMVWDDDIEFDSKDYLMFDIVS